MEYLMTYGWALLVIVIVIAILLLINPFSAPQGCRFDQLGFTCSNAIVTGSNGFVYLSVTNGNSNAITVTNVTCVSGTSPTTPPFTTQYTSGVNGAFWYNSLIQPQTTFSLTNYTTGVAGTYTQNVTCRMGYNNPAVFSGTPGTTFSGLVYIYYKNQQDPPNYPDRVAVATVTTKVQ